jgi:hypothetical protein
MVGIKAGTHEIRGLFKKIVFRPGGPRGPLESEIRQSVFLKGNNTSLIGIVSAEIVDA